MKNSIIINKEDIQEEARGELKRVLSPEEYEQVRQAMIIGLFKLARENIRKVVEHNETLKRYEIAEKIFPHYIVYQRNGNKSQPKFEKISVFNNEKDAKNFILNDFILPNNERRVVLVDKNNIKKEVYQFTAL